MGQRRFTKCRGLILSCCGVPCGLHPRIPRVHRRRPIPSRAAARQTHGGGGAAKWDPSRLKVCVSEATTPAVISHELIYPGCVITWADLSRPLQGALWNVPSFKGSGSLRGRYRASAASRRPLFRLGRSVVGGIGHREILPSRGDGAKAPVHIFREVLHRRTCRAISELRRGKHNETALIDS
ncbi:hypothetical protein F5883DRAFT_232676 [Diaporthe sp. PMI_573]|nr:hypothetical protein F5883DRAFT_232676 [Diaporthaceae sp. PMI_573]